MRVHCEWGPAGAAKAGDGVIVIVDVLSFSTAVTVAVSRGMAVYPAPPGDTAAAVAREVDAVLARRRGEETAERPWSLSPAALMKGPATPRLVLPSPNGSAIAAGARRSAVTVLVGCLRNASAVARHTANAPDRAVTVVPAGERWPDGSLRPALEDWLGAGAILSALERIAAVDLSPEAQAAAAMFEATSDVAVAVAGCVSGRELRDRGYGADVGIAAELDRSLTVPMLIDGAFRAAA